MQNACGVHGIAEPVDVHASALHRCASVLNHDFTYAICRGRGTRTMRDKLLKLEVEVFFTRSDGLFESG